MTVEALMTETVTVAHNTGEFVQDSSGEPTPIYTFADTVMYLEPQQDARRSTEALEVGYVFTGLWLGFGLASFPFDSHDQITFGDHVFDVIAPPRLMWNPRLGVNSHYELDLQEIEGDEVISMDAVAHPAAVGGTGGV